MALALYLMSPLLKAFLSHQLRGGVGIEALKVQRKEEGALAAHAGVKDVASSSLWRGWGTAQM